MGKRLDISKCFNDALAVYKQHWAMLVVLNLILGVLTVFTLGILAGPLTVGYNLVLLELLRGRKDKIEVADLFKFFNRFWPLLGLFCLFVLIIFGGLFLLILPGVFFAIMLMYIFYLAADKELGPIDAIKESWHIVLSKGIGLNFAIAALSGLIVFVIQMVPFLGTILAFFVNPFAVLLIASAYIQQTEDSQGSLEEKSLESN